MCCSDSTDQLRVAWDWVADSKTAYYIVVIRPRNPRYVALAAEHLTAAHVVHVGLVTLAHRFGNGNLQLKSQVPPSSVEIALNMA